ncbi:mediator complex subunit 13 C-terminal-domain-containing protein [Desarmillaria tabescens]|uniref:Mediator of RNA polymerase II transcription subunit 13 n=1 Tax=Armillaria tabescens TaxID=1929756 RepID=A0AA39NLE3_ARMTA|nr:mediator complex subunit 13 C-terminal-domain-containing protein [Desarmillaria tabescens]KAK0467791.1 mediator complex subunit 13 C-terminal-domain-containing protein [Desarmillaria tabescens]
MSLNVATTNEEISNVAYLVASSSSPATIDAFRRRIAVRHTGSSLLDSLLSSVHVAATSYIYLFRIIRGIQLDSFNDLDFNGLNVVESSSFSPQDIVFPTFPAKALRTVISHFLNSVRIRLLDDISHDASVLGRLNSGFLIAHSTASNEWSAPWAIMRPLVYCHLQVHLMSSRLLIHPLVIPTSFLPVTPSLTQGSPILLLPYATPAYFLASYKGPCSALSKQFKECFEGLGVSSWDPESYIIAWVSVENRQGEDKGVMIIYPTSLCVRSLSPNIPSLPHIPTLPATLQSSPQSTPSLPFLSVSSPTSVSAFRTLTISKSRDIKRVAKEVGSYVDAVAKERERERERLKREREGVGTSVAQPPSTQVPHLYVQQQAQLQQQQQTQQQQMQQQQAQQQQQMLDFYPSPPQTNLMVPPPSGHVSPTVPVAAPMDVDPQPNPAPSQPSYEPFNSNWMDMEDWMSGLGDTVNVGNGGDRGMGIGMMDFEADFTEDDFSFFDDKPPPPMPAVTGLTPAAPLEEPHWEIEPTPDIGTGLPSPPAESVLNFRVDDIKVQMKVDTAGGLWDAIPFADSYRATDGKYNMGKFSSSPGRAEGWRKRYEKVTDPRLGVVKRLALRRAKSVDEPERDDWEAEWREGNPEPEEDSDGVDDSDEDMESGGEEESVDETEGERPCTPLPAWIPMGPALLPMHFRHEVMLPLSAPLRSGVVGGSSGVGAGVSSVPTPVSPGRVGKGKSLQAAAESLGKEIVENSVWAAVWDGVNAKGNSGGIGRILWEKDVQVVSRLFSSVQDINAPVQLEKLFGLAGSSGTSNGSESRLEKLEAPMLLVGKGDAVIQVSPPALRFWDKLGLGPRSGKKDIQAFVVFDSTQEQMSDKVSEWLINFRTIYEGKHFGKVLLGQSQFCEQDMNGVVPIRYDSALRKTLDAFIAGSSPPPPRTSIVVFIVTSITTMTLLSHTLRQLFSIVRKASASHPQMLFHFIPEQTLYSEFKHLLRGPVQFVPVVRSMSRKLSSAGEVTKFLEDPAFVLARTPEESKVVYSGPKADATAMILGVMDKGTFLHVGYGLSECGKWIFASCNDQRGDGHDLGVWLTSKGGGEANEGEDEMTFLVHKVWDFTARFAKKANIEWRIVIAKLGSMGEAELDAWTRYLETDTEMGPVHVSVVAVEPSTPWMFTSRPEFDTPKSVPPSLKSVGRSASVSSSKPSKHNSHPVFVDIAFSTYALFQQSPLPVSVPPTLGDLGLDLGYIPDPSPWHSGEETHPQSPSIEHDHSNLPHVLPLIPHASATLIRVPSTTVATTTMLHIHLLHVIRSVGCSYPASDYNQLFRDITHSYYALSVLSSLKWRMKSANPILPSHLGAVEAMRTAVMSGGSVDTPE